MNEVRPDNAYQELHSARSGVLTLPAHLVLDIALGKLRTRKREAYKD